MLSKHWKLPVCLNTSNLWQLFSQKVVLDVWLGSEYTSGTMLQDSKKEVSTLKRSRRTHLWLQIIVVNKLVDIFAVTFYQSCTFEKLPSPLLSNDKLVKLKLDPQKTTLTLKILAKMGSVLAKGYKHTSLMELPHFIYHTLSTCFQLLNKKMSFSAKQNHCSPLSWFFHIW